MVEDNAKIVINVAGDYVQNKHVDYEIGNVENGGIGIQISNGEKKDISLHKSSRPAAGRTVAAKKARHFLETLTFRYRFFASDPESNRRIHLLYGLLCRQYKETKSFIDPDTPPDAFFNLFTGERSGDVVVWTGDKQDLSYLIKRLVERKIVEIPNGMTIWTITENHFSDYRGNFCGDYRSQHAPVEARRSAIEALIDILDPQQTSTADLDEQAKKLSVSFSGS